MSFEVTELRIRIPDHTTDLRVYPIGRSRGRCYELPAAEADAFGESPYQIVEGYRYEYELPGHFRLEAPHGIVEEMRSHPSCGTITARNIPGLLQVRVIVDDGSPDRLIDLEVRTEKIDYRRDYRFMLEAIAGKCTELLMQADAPVYQTFAADPAREAATAYQRFSFAKSIVMAPEFQHAVHHFLESPAVRWAEERHAVPMNLGRRMRRTDIRQIAAGSNRIRLPPEHPLENVVKSLPREIAATRKRETVDTPENRFVKHALSTFLLDIAQVRAALQRRRDQQLADGTIPTRDVQEATACEAWLEEILQHSIFAEISAPDLVALNSPLLRRKHGYREIYRAWLVFDLAAKLTWKGGDDVYGAGKKDIATLYEYWIFFEMLSVFQQVFATDSKIQNPIEATDDGLGLKLKSGSRFDVNGSTSEFGRELNATFSYNRTFGGPAQHDQPGSYSLSMRPDCTISIWPAKYGSADDAEKKGSIVHLHFDAKYRIDRIAELFPKVEDLAAEKSDERRGIYRRADLLKMHAYKDAVRRTGGAYILYPGLEGNTFRGYHELLPGLGAFGIRPDQESGIQHVRAFLTDVLKQFGSGISQYERIAVLTRMVHEYRDSYELRRALPILEEGDQFDE